MRYKKTGLQILDFWTSKMSDALSLKGSWSLIRTFLAFWVLVGFGGSACGLFEADLKYPPGLPELRDKSQ